MKAAQGTEETVRAPRFPVVVLAALEELTSYLQYRFRWQHFIGSPSPLGGVGAGAEEWPVFGPLGSAAEEGKRLHGRREGTLEGARW